MPVDALRDRMLQDLHDVGFTNIVAAHFAVFRYPGPQGRRPSEVAAEAGMSRQAMNYLLGELENMGFLDRRDDDEDKRSRRIELTDRGYAVQRTMRETVAAFEVSLEKDLGAKKVERLRQLLESVNDSTLVREFRQSTGQQRVVAPQA